MRGVNQIRREVSEYWKDISLPYPEPGIRLIRQADLVQLDNNLGNYQRKLAEAVEYWSPTMVRLSGWRCERLGRLYSDADYPATFIGLFQFCWTFQMWNRRTTWLRSSRNCINKEWNRVRSRFEEAVQLAEQAFTDELSGLIAHLSERLSGLTMANPKSSATARSRICTISSSDFNGSTFTPAVNWNRWWEELSRF